MKNIALATCRQFADLTIEDKLLADCLRNLGFNPKPLVWDAPNQPLDEFAAVVIRSCWDYHKKPDEFLNWIDKLETNGVNLLNPPEVLRRNLDKIYLRGLNEAGFKIPPTVWLKQGETGDLAKILVANSWSKAVIKPTISATAWRTFVATTDNADRLQAEFENLLSNGGVIIQKFVKEIQTKGEWSFVFFDKKFSHAVLKRAKSGDFRVQSNFGGVIAADIHPAPNLIAEAQRIVDKADENLSYARVDGVEIAGEFFLMELELIEPVLFLENDKSAAQKFAETIVRAS